MFKTINLLYRDSFVRYTVITVPIMGYLISNIPYLGLKIKFLSKFISTGVVIMILHVHRSKKRSLLKEKENN